MAKCGVIFVLCFQLTLLILAIYAGYTSWTYMILVIFLAYYDH